MPDTISAIHAYEIIDSKGQPTIEASLTLSTGAQVVTSVPSAHTTTPYDALDVRDEDPARFRGKGVLHAVSYINDLVAPKLKNVDVLKTLEIDNWLIKADGTKNKSRLGVNTMLTISQLVMKAAAHSAGVPLYTFINQVYTAQFKDPIVIDRIPIPIFNMVNGGRHGGGSMEFQEFQIIPSSSLTFGAAYQRAIEFYQELKTVLTYRNVTTAVGEEGGFSPNLSANLDVLEILNETLNQVKLRSGLDMFFGLDLAASTFHKNGIYTIKDKPNPLKQKEYVDFLKSITSNYSILVIEDPVAPEDISSWKKLSTTLGPSIYLTGDEMISSSYDRLALAIRENLLNAIIIKPNQVGTLYELFRLVHFARQNSIAYICAARSSETTDTFLADLSVGLQSEFVKFGSPTRGERVAKYNRLWQIERDELKTPPAPAAAA